MENCTPDSPALEARTGPFTMTPSIRKASEPIGTARIHESKTTPSSSKTCGCEEDEQGVSDGNDGAGEIAKAASPEDMSDCSQDAVAAGAQPCRLLFNNEHGSVDDKHIGEKQPCKASEVQVIETEEASSDQKQESEPVEEHGVRRSSRLKRSQSPTRQHEESSSLRNNKRVKQDNAEKTHATEEPTLRRSTRSTATKDATTATSEKTMSVKEDKAEKIHATDEPTRRRSTQSTTATSEKNEDSSRSDNAVVKTTEPTTEAGNSKLEVRQLRGRRAKSGEENRVDEAAEVATSEVDDGASRRVSTRTRKPIPSATAAQATAAVPKGSRRSMSSAAAVTEKQQSNEEAGGKNSSVVEERIVDSKEEDVSKAEGSNQRGRTRLSEETGFAGQSEGKVFRSASIAETLRVHDSDDGDDDDILSDAYVPLKEREKAALSSKGAAAKKNENAEVPSSMKEEKALADKKRGGGLQASSLTETPDVKALKAVHDPADIQLGRLRDMGSSFNSLKCLWPIRRIRNVNGLSAETMKALTDKGLVGRDQSITTDRLFAFVFGTNNHKWHLMEFPLNFKVVAFDDKVERDKIEKELSSKIKSRAREELRFAMNVAEAMYKRASEELDQLEKLISERTEEEMNLPEAPAVIKPEVRPLTPTKEQLEYNTKPKGVEFRPGLPVLLLLANFDQRFVETEVAEVMSLGENSYQVRLRDNTLLTDGHRILVGDNKVFLPYEDLKVVSTFVEGKEGRDMGEVMRELMDGLRQKAVDIMSGRLDDTFEN